jgi:hypothetical protein
MGIRWDTSEGVNRSISDRVMSTLVYSITRRVDNCAPRVKMVYSADGASALLLNLMEPTPDPDLDLAPGKRRLIEAALRLTAGGRSFATLGLRA